MNEFEQMCASSILGVRLVSLGLSYQKNDAPSIKTDRLYHTDCISSLFFVPYEYFFTGAQKRNGLPPGGASCLKSDVPGRWMVHPPAEPLLLTKLFVCSFSFFDHIKAKEPKEERQSQDECDNSLTTIKLIPLNPVLQANPSHDNIHLHDTTTPRRPS